MPGHDQRVRDQLHRWREELINLGRTNRLLFHKPTKSSTLEILAPDPNTVLERLSNGRAGSWHFFGPPEPTEDDPVIRKAKDWANRRGSNELLTQKTEQAALDSALRLLSRRATQEYVDRGLSVLYLAAGFLEWVDPQSQERGSAPLLLVPVELHRDNPRVPYELRRTDDDVRLNQALVVRLQRLGIDLPEFDSNDLDEGDVGGVLAAVDRATRHQWDWQVTDQIVLGIFSFHKEVMYRDLLDHEDQVLANDAVRGLALGPEADVDLGFDPIPEARLDELAPPEHMVSIRDTDATQRQCIAAAREGRSFVMDGPPGTGKSQTIANVIAELITAGKTVLFVSEKAAALEVVQARLSEAGLGEFLLELHSHKATRKEVAQELGRALSTRPVAGRPMARSSLETLMTHRRELSHYAAAMNETREALGESLFAIQGRIAQLQHLPQAPVAKAIGQNLDLESHNRFIAAAGDLARAWGPVVRGDDFLWRGAAAEAWDATEQYEARESLRWATQALSDLERYGQLNAEEVGVAAPRDPMEVSDFADFLQVLRSRPVGVPAWWLSDIQPGDVRRRLIELHSASVQHDRLTQEARSQAGDSWRDLHHEPTLDTTAELFAQTSLGWDLELTTTSNWLERTESFLGTSASVLTEVRAITDDTREAFTLANEQVDPARADEIAELATLASSPTPPPAVWFEPSILPRLEEGLERLQPLILDYRQRRESLSGVFTKAALELDLDGLTWRFQTQHRGLQRLKGAYRADRRTLRAGTPNGKVGKETIRRLGEARSWQKVAQELDSAARDVPSLSDSTYYDGPDTDLVAVDNAIQVTRRAIDLAGTTDDARALPRILAQGGGRSWDLAEQGRKARALLQDWRSDAASHLEEHANLPASATLSDGIDWCREAGRLLDELRAQIDHVSRVVGQDVDLGTASSLIALRVGVAAIEGELRRTEAEDLAMLGDGFRGLDTDWEGMFDRCTWFEEVLDHFPEPLDSSQAAILVEVAPDVDQLRGALATWEKTRDDLLGRFIEERTEEIGPDFDVPFPDVRRLLEDLEATIDDVAEWVSFRSAAAALKDAGLGPAVDFCIDNGLPTDHVVGVITRSLLEAWVDTEIRNDPRLGSLRATDRDELVRSFRELDRELIATASAKAIEACTSRRPNAAVGQAGIIQRQATMKMKHMPVRTLLDQAGSVAQALKPCFMMSPLTVSQFLPAGLRFDCVIFDEASQVKPADSVNCVYRGDQLIVAGDQKQLPPSSFFERLDEEEDEYVEDQLDTFESVLDLCKAAGWMRSLPLRWHYRSQHEDLITFSNYRFYEGGLVTFPAQRQEGTDLGIQLYRVPGVYRRGGARDNQIEAEAVLERVLFHAEHHPELTLGVVAFSEAQAGCIESEIERERQMRPDLDSYFEGDRLDGFFVKALEAVQGDERDIIIFSLGYGPDEIGRFTQNFGPLNRDGGWRRLNVAVTRARRRVEIVSSVTAADFLQFDAINSQGVRELVKYLSYAERGVEAIAVDLTDSQGDAESPFEEEVIRVIERWGYEAVPQVGHAGYRIDIGVRHPERRGAYALGIECDGAMYHSSQVARDRDRLRQEVLERLGWRIYRIWGTAWYRDRAREEDRLRLAIESALAGGTKPPAPSPAVAKAEQEVREIDLGQAPPWARPYTVTKLSRGRGFGRFPMHAPEALPELRRMVLEVVRTEAPVHAEVALTRLREAWGVGRAGNRIRQSFNSTLRALKSSGSLRQDGDFLLRSEDLPVVVRTPRLSDPATLRGVGEIHPLELDYAVVKMVEEARAIEDDELTRSVASIFGWSRRGPEISAGMTASVRRLLHRQVLQRVDGRLTLGEQAS